MLIIPTTQEVEDHSSRAVSKKLVSLLNKKKMLGVVAHVYNLSYTGGIGKRITVHI
jgi:hypothetical protein